MLPQRLETRGRLFGKASAHPGRELGRVGVSHVPCLEVDLAFLLYRGEFPLLGRLAAAGAGAAGCRLLTATAAAALAS